MALTTKEKIQWALFGAGIAILVGVVIVLLVL
jgi:hypothetical protein